MSQPRKTGGNKLVIVMALFAIVIALSLVYFRDRLSGLRAQVTPKDVGGAAEVRGRLAHEEVALAVPDEAAEIAFALSVHDPARVRRALSENAWLAAALKEPIGHGFSLAWSAFLTSKGEDLRAAFSGSVASYLFDSVLAQPFSLVWLTGPMASGAPAVIVPQPTAAARAAFAALGAATARGTLRAAGCPRARASGKLEAGAKPDTEHVIVRWLIADQALYAALGADRLVLAAKPMSVLQGLCLAGTAAPPTSSSAPLELELHSERLGREAQLLAVLMGLKDVLRLGVDIVAGRFVPKGISGAMLRAERLAVAAPSDALLRMIPDELPVAALLQLALPERLDEHSLGEFLAGKSGALRARSVALLWQPHGARQPSRLAGAAPSARPAEIAPGDIALVWGTPAEQGALRAIFPGASLHVSVVCDHLVMSSSVAFERRLAETCAGQWPSRLQAQPGVVEGARASGSVALHLQLGSLLSGLMTDAFSLAHPGQASTDLDAARATLRELPFFGFTGRVEGAALIAAGFRS